VVRGLAVLGKSAKRPLISIYRSLAVLIKQFMSLAGIAHLGPYSMKRVKTKKIRLRLSLESFREEDISYDV
jgi:hypothetical protein